MTKNPKLIKKFCKTRFFCNMKSRNSRENFNMHRLESQGETIIFSNSSSLKNHSLHNSNHVSPGGSPHVLAYPSTSPQQKPHTSATPVHRTPKLHPVYRCIQSLCWWRYHPWHDPHPILSMKVWIAAGYPGLHDQWCHSYRKSDHQWPRIGRPSPWMTPLWESFHRP